MTGIRLAVVGLGVILAGCGTSSAGSPRPAPEPELSVTMLGFDADGFAAGPFAALSRTPINLGAFLSWYAGGDDAAHIDKKSDGPLPEKPTYVAVTGSTSCRTPTDVAVSRDGNDLKVEFVGGEDHPECMRAVGPVVYLAVPSDAVAGVRTVNGAAPASPNGPGELLGLVPLGESQLGPVPPVELGTPAAAAMRDALTTASDPAAVATALAYQPQPGRRGFGFVLNGCPKTDAALLLERERITAEIGMDCDTHVPFLATFAIDARRVPETAVLTG